MSQSGAGGSNGSQTQAQDQDQRSGEQKNDSVLRSDGQTSQILCQNGRAEAGTTISDNSKSDISNGFENRTIEYERFGMHERNQNTVGIFEQAPQTRAPLPYPANFSDLPPEYTATPQQTIQYPTLRHPSTTGQPEDRHPMIAQLPPQHYQAEKASNDRVQHVSQTSTQTLPVQAQPHFVTEYVGDQIPQYTQIRPGQFEVRSQMYTQQQQQQAREYGDRAGYVTRDVTYREQAGAALYGHPQSTGNPVFSGTGPYVTVQHAGSQLPSQSTSPQPPYYTGMVVPSQAPPGYGQFSTGQPQYPYSQYPQTVMNPIPYTPHGSIYQPQQFSQQSPNPQRFSQDLSQYQAQPIIQPIAQNVMTATEKSGGRGPKPMVPPRGNSKITHGDPNIKKQATVEVPGQKTTSALPSKYEPPVTQNPQVSQEQVIRGEATLLIAGTHIGPDGQERRFLSPINQNPRTRQDGLYVDLNGEQVPRENAAETVASECGFYVARSEHRKSVSVDVTTSFQRRNDTITFTFPGDIGQHDTMATRKTASLGERKRPEGAQVFPVEARRVDPVLRVPPMAFDQRQENRKSIVPERKPEWGNVSPNQRPGTMSAQENRRSDYFEEHRRSPMNLETKRMEDVRRSPMPFVPIRDLSSDRATQKSPSFGNQNFEKTRQELAMWAEQRQRQDLERGMFPGQMFSTSPRSRNQSEERRDPRTVLSAEESRKDPRLPQAPFQPISNITQSSIMEQRRHLRHVSADLTKHMELSRKDFDDQPITGSVANLVPVLGNTITSQRASPNICHQYPALSEAKLDSKALQLTVVTDFVGDNHTPKSGGENSDHIIHSHKKSHNVTTNLLTHSKSQTDNLQSQAESHNDKIDSLQAQQQQQQQQNQQMQNQQMQNQQSLDMISEKLSQFERQQSDLQAKLQCLQNQNQILDKVAMFQHQADLHVRFQCLQGEKGLRQATDYQPKNLVGEMQQIKLSPLPDHLLDPINGIATNAQDQQQQHQQTSHRQSLLPLPTYVSAQSLQNQACQSMTCERLSPRLPLVDSADLNSAVVGQIAMGSNADFERSEFTRGSLQYRLTCPSEVSENIPVMASTSTTANTSTISASANATGTLRKVPPEKPPRTSLIVQSPETESNRSQPAIGLKQTPKARAVCGCQFRRLINVLKGSLVRCRRRKQKVSILVSRNMDDGEIQSTVESILGPGVKVIDCEKKNCVREEEVLLINGVPIALEGPDGVAIREAMITGQIPPCDLLNQILVRAGILRAPVRLETSLSVKSTVVTKEEVTVARGGKVVDERSRETKENNFYASSTSEIWEPVGIIHRPRNIKPFDSSDDSRPNSNASSDQGYTTNTSTNHVLRVRGGAAYGCPICEDTDPDCAKRCLGGLSGLGAANPNRVAGVQTTTSAPTIFGTVASDLNPKDGNSRRSLPQTPAGGVGGKGLGGAGSASGMVNGASSDHQDIRDASAINLEHALVYRDGNLVSGSLEALVQHMVPTEEYYPDRAYLFAFLLSARLFIKPHELLGDVCALCEHQQNLNGEGGKERLHRFVPRLVQLLAEWTETFPYDFRDERVMGHVRSITQKVAAVDAAARQEVSALLQNLLLRLTALERYEEGLARLSTEATTEQLTQVDVTELCPSATVLAQQLTHVELERLSYIGPEEFVQAFAKESPHLETSFKDMKKTRNLESYVQWFNRLSYFVATEVCKHAKKKQRVRVVEYWIEAARECFNIGNFNSLMAIIAGLNMSPISRLKKTWSKVQSAKFSILEHQMDPSSNFSSYRSTLKAAMWRSAGATDERQRIVVPFFSLLVKDLYFLNEGCSNKLPNGHINFEKFWQLAKQVTEFIAWKQVACPFEKNSRVIAFLQASPVLTENALALASFECEPPDNNTEKERYKALKSELNAQ